MLLYSLSGSIPKEHNGATCSAQMGRRFMVSQAERFLAGDPVSNRDQAAAADVVCHRNRASLEGRSFIPCIVPG
jgi:hypothetical protein